MQARHDKGVLTLEIPVAEEAKPRKVEVRAESTGGEARTVKTGSEAAARPL